MNKGGQLFSRGKKQRGAYLVMMTFVLILMVGLGGLVIDTARLLILKTEMQNAIDAAALAAAKELDGTSDAFTNAIVSAQQALVHSTHFSRLANILSLDTGAITLPASHFTFYSCIGSRYDIESCTGKTITTTPNEAIYVEVFFDPSIASAANYFTLDFIFIPILTLLSDSTGSPIAVATSGRVSVKALAGNSVFTCRFPPIALCDPFDDGDPATDVTFRTEVPVGSDIQLKQQGSNQWANGNFGFLVPITGKGGATSVAEAIADEGVVGCSPAIVSTAPGGMTQKTKAAINTRFGDYTSPAPFNRSDAPDLWPPDFNITEYPSDEGSLGIDSRFGNGVWDVDAYWASAHPPSTTAPAGLKANGDGPGNEPTRYQTHQWEVDNGMIPVTPSQGVPTADRRLLHVAVISCTAAGLAGGKSTAVISRPDGFAKIFLTRKATNPPSAEIWGEYAGWVDESDSNYHVDVQLYE